MECPTCNGKKAIPMFQNTGTDYRKHTYGPVKCPTCRGTGVVADDYPERLAEGKKMRKERIQRGESLMAAATRQGITPAQLSAIENGRGHSR